MSDIQSWGRVIPLGLLVLNMHLVPRIGKVAKWQRSNQRHPLPRTWPTGRSGDRALLPVIRPVVCLPSDVLKAKKINKKARVPTTQYEDSSASDPSLLCCARCLLAQSPSGSMSHREASSLLRGGAVVAAINGQLYSDLHQPLAVGSTFHDTWYLWNMIHPEQQASYLLTCLPSADTENGYLGPCSVRYYFSSSSLYFLDFPKSLFYWNVGPYGFTLVFPLLSS